MKKGSSITARTLPMALDEGELLAGESAFADGETGTSPLHKVAEVGGEVGHDFCDLSGLIKINRDNLDEICNFDAVKEVRINKLFVVGGCF